MSPRRARAFALGIGLAAALGAGVAEAVPCSVTGNAWNPDPTVSNASTCGAGDAPAVPANDPNNNDPQITLNGIAFTEWDRDQDASLLNNADGGFFITGTTKGGFWYWDASDSLDEGNDLFAIVLKGGNVTGVATKWAWFILENPSGPESDWLTHPITAGNCAGDALAPAAGTYTHCGTWSMFGNVTTTTNPNGQVKTTGDIKDLSHVSLYGADVLPEESPEPPTTDVPEPHAVVLIGLGLAGATLLVLRFRKVVK